MDSETANCSPGVGGLPGQVAPPVLQVEVALEVVRHVVGVAAGEGGADGADHLLAGLGVLTRNVFLGRGVSPPSPPTCSVVSV